MRQFCVERCRGTVQALNTRLPGYKTCALTILPKKHSFGQMARVHNQLEYRDRTFSFHICVSWVQTQLWKPWVVYGRAEGEQEFHLHLNISSDRMHWQAFAASFSTLLISSPFLSPSLLPEITSITLARHQTEIIKQEERITVPRLKVWLYRSWRQTAAAWCDTLRSNKRFCFFFPFSHGFVVLFFLERCRCMVADAMTRVTATYVQKAV